MGIGAQSLGRLHHLLGRSNAIAHVAQKVRNQAAAVVASHFSDIYPPAWNADPAVNGEFSLIDLVAPAAANFIDVGAHVGSWSERFIERMKTPRGLLVDGDARCIETLRSKFGGIAGLTILHAALSDYCGEGAFYEREGVAAGYSSLSRIISGRPSSFAGSRVEVSTLDKEVGKLGWTNVSMVKVDAEGHDFFVLRGARKLFELKKIDFIQFECNSTWIGINITAAVHFLAELGYETFQLCRGGLRAVDADKYGSSAISGNWLAFHSASPSLPLKRFS
jgi:FkbM family methyltransferase